MKRLKRKREPFLKVPSISKEVEKNCGIASSTNSAYLPVLSLINYNNNSFV
jgi:hypothetical protein